MISYAMSELDFQDALASQTLLDDPRDGEEAEHLERGGGKVSNAEPGLSAGDPREGEETEHLEKGGGKMGSFVPLLAAVGPRDGEKTEPVEEGDR